MQDQKQQRYMESLNALGKKLNEIFEKKSHSGFEENPKKVLYCLKPAKTQQFLNSEKKSDVECKSFEELQRRIQKLQLQYTIQRQNERQQKIQNQYPPGLLQSESFTPNNERVQLQSPDVLQLHIQELQRQHMAQRQNQHQQQLPSQHPLDLLQLGRFTPNDKQIELKKIEQTQLQVQNLQRQHMTQRQNQNQQHLQSKHHLDLLQLEMATPNSEQIKLKTKEESQLKVPILQRQYITMRQNEHQQKIQYQHPPGPLQSGSFTPNNERVQLPSLSVFQLQIEELKRQHSRQKQNLFRQELRSKVQLHQLQLESLT